MTANQDLMSLARKQLKGMWGLGVGVTIITIAISIGLNLIPLRRQCEWRSFI